MSRQTDRQTDRQIHRQTDRQTDRQTGTYTHTHRQHRQAHTHIHTDTDTDGHTLRLAGCFVDFRFDTKDITTEHSAYVDELVQHFTEINGRFSTLGE